MTVSQGDVVRLAMPGKWADDLLMIVEETHDWGLVGIIPTPQGEAPLRVRHSDVAAVWQPQKQS